MIFLFCLLSLSRDDVTLRPDSHISLPFASALFVGVCVYERARVYVCVYALVGHGKRMHVHPPSRDSPSNTHIHTLTPPKTHSHTY